MFTTRWNLAYLWLVLVVLAWYRADDLIPLGQAYNGTKIDFIVYSHQKVKVDGESIGLQAASSQHFIFMSETGRVIESRFTVPPLGWSDEYHFVMEEDVAYNQWRLIEGDRVYLILSAEKSMEVYNFVSDFDYESRIVSLYVLIAGLGTLGFIAIAKSFRKPD